MKLMLKYLEQTLIPQRRKELKEGENLATDNPIYVVYSLEEKACKGHDCFMHSTNLKGKEPVKGYVDLSEDERELIDSDEGMQSPEEVTVFWIDRVAAFFFTSKGAHEYVKDQAHNLTNGYVYVHCAGYANRELGALFNEIDLVS